MYKIILTAIDLTDDSSWAKSVPTAIELCQSTGARLDILTVLPDFGMSIVSQHFPKDYAENAMAETVTKLEAFVREHVPESIETTVAVVQGTIYEEIIRVSQKVSADLIIVAASRPSLKDFLLGPNAARVVRHADCSVLVVRG
ncbi:MAG: universal stress protein [Rhodospirillaceae bacterium]|jgi:nucleotide-binding universal stress UspA family protein|nr:universal stress protein [Rhodospirillaceae bacterium]